MNLIFDSTLFIQNIKSLEKSFSEVTRSYKLTRDNDGRFILDEKELILLKLYGAKYVKMLNVHSNKKHVHLNEGRVVREKNKEIEVSEVYTYVSNKYLHIIGKRKISINIKNIESIEVFGDRIIIKHNLENHTLLLGNTDNVCQIVFLLDVLSNVKIDSSNENKTIDIGIQ